MKIIGKPSINLIYFISGKLLGYFTWSILFLSFAKVISVNQISIPKLDYVAYILFFIGITFVIGSLINLGRSTRLGLPYEKTSFINNGFYFQL